jgi:type IX secretion system PorP/SprF family membrane protein
MGVFAALMFQQGTVRAQDVHFTQFDASPLILNPANTGAFNGDWRASVVYRDQWRSIAGNSAFKTYAASFDMPIIRDISVDDYLAAGVQLYNDRAGDGNLTNFSALLSVAYHKFLGEDARKVLTVGLQGGYSQKSIDWSRLYFENEFDEGQWNPGINPDRNFLGTGDGYFVINAGISYAQAVSDNFSFTVGAGVNNINQPLETFDTREKSVDVGLGMRYTGQLGAIIQVGDRFALKPAVLYQSQNTAMELVAGNEFHYTLGEDYELPTAPAVFAGVWYRHMDAIMVTVGVEFKGFRIGFGYDYNNSKLNAASNGNGGFEVSLHYIAPSALSFARKLLYPCGRF